MTDLSYVRRELVPSEAPPSRSFGPVAWLRRNLFSSLGDTILTLTAAVVLIWFLPQVYEFVIGKAVFTDPQGIGVEACRLPDLGACWLFVYDRIDFFIYAFYPAEEYWRVNICFALAAILIIPMLWPGVPFKRVNIALFLIALPIIALILIPGGSFGLEFIPTEKWGGLMVTLIISIVGITLSIPLGILLALGRQSTLPVIKYVSIAYIELWRAVPLITVLFMASVMLPLFLPQGVSFDKLLRALVGVTLFEAAYLAEVVRGGLQALPRGQYEAGASLGLNYWKQMTFVILPQALKHVIPGIVGNFISLFKDTSLVAIVGIFDLLNAVQNTTNNTDWRSPTTAQTGYLTAAFIFWVFCFSMSRYSQYMERRLNTGHKR